MRLLLSLRPSASSIWSTTRSAILRKAVSLPPAMESTPAGPVQSSSLREMSDADLPSSATRGRTPDQAEAMSTRVSGDTENHAAAAVRR